MNVSVPHLQTPVRGVERDSAREGRDQVRLPQVVDW